MRDRASSLSDRTIHARALTTAAVAALLVQGYAEARELSREALDIATATGDRNLQAAAHARIAVTSARLDDFDTAIDEAALAEALFAESDNKRGLATLLTNQAALLMRLGLFEATLSVIERSNALLEIVRERRMSVANAVNASFVQLRIGAPVEAKRFASEGLAMAREIGFPAFEAAALANLGNAERALGNVDHAIELMQRGLAIRRAIQELPDFADDVSDLIHALVDAGRADEALAAARELATLDADALRNAFWPHYCLWSAAAGFAAGGDVGAAAEFRREARATLERFAQLVPAGATRQAFRAIDVSRAIADSAHAGRTPVR